MVDGGIHLSRRPLTSRQSEVLKLIVDGHSLKEIAYRLSITYSAAAQHRIKLMDKLRVHELAGLIRYAIENPEETIGIKEETAIKSISHSAGSL
jgi:DNA-binding NarL/FixJ family response regulator